MLILLRFQAAAAILTSLCALESTKMRCDGSGMANGPPGPDVAGIDRRDGESRSMPLAIMVMWWPLIVDSNYLMSIRILYLPPNTWKIFSNRGPFEAWICLIWIDGGI
ncbi:hypothetical protein NKH19_30450 [Mesorhizobium sp. M1338]|uniref:hypothetical protein n=1 Tax=unclassified Mesorhizobium TaxID=325217 RepID=UPI00333B88CA